MSEDQQPTNDTNVAVQQNARVGYRAAVNLITYEGEGVWARFNVMLVANSIIMAVIGSALTSERVLPVLTVCLPIAGVLLCAWWFVLLKRGFDYRRYWILSARELEERYLANPVKTLSRGGVFADDDEEPVSFIIGGETRPYRMSRLGRIRFTKWYWVIILMFAILYGLMLVQAVIVWGN